MYIKNIHMKNFHGSEDFTSKFYPGVNIIIGKNGAGKTSLLRGLKILLSSILAGDEHISQAQILKEEVRLTSITIGDATPLIEYHFPSIVEGDIELNGLVSHCKSARKNENSDDNDNIDNIVHVFDNDYDDKVEEQIKLLLNDKTSELPLISYHSDQRNILAVPQTRQISPSFIERRKGYEGTITGVYAEDIINNWCLNMELRNLQEGKKIMEYETFKKTIIQFMNIIEDREFQGNIYFDVNMWTLVYSDGRNRQPLYNLSSGYQSLLCMIIELTYRAALLNPGMRDYSSVKGVVLIDEIYMHLHPEWQWRIIDALNSVFPKVQFIVATHSPIIISSAENAHLLLMESPNGEVKPLDDAYGINVDDVLELRQRSKNMPPVLKVWRKRIMDSLNNNDIGSAEEVIHEATAEHGKDSALVRKLIEFLRINRWIAEA